MGKKSKKQNDENSGITEKSASTTPTNNPSYHRVSYLYQSARMLATSEKKAHKKLASFYVSVMKEVRRKTRVRVHPYQKRTICKKCDSILTFGNDSNRNAKLRWKSKRSAHLVVTCTKCKSVKRFLAGNDKKLKIEQGLRE